MIDLSAFCASWPNQEVATIAAFDADEVRGSCGDTAAIHPVASISKLFTALAVLVAIEEETLDLDEPAGRPDATVRHLLSHTAGFDFDRPRFNAEVGDKRIYSNVGIEVLAEHLAIRADMEFADYLRVAVLEPLALASTELKGSPATDVHTSVDDLVKLGFELMTPTIIHPSTLEMATKVHFPGLAGVLPGWGRFDPLPWGLGFEIKGQKDPHWSGRITSTDTFGHFGGAGTYLFVDPGREIGVAAISGTPFDDWAVEAWPETNDGVVEALGYR